MVATLGSKSLRERDQSLYLSRYVGSLIPKNSMPLGVGVSVEKPKERDFVELRTWVIIWTFASTGLRARELREIVN